MPGSSIDTPSLLLLTPTATSLAVLDYEGQAPMYALAAACRSDLRCHSFSTSGALYSPADLNLQDSVASQANNDSSQVQVEGAYLVSDCNFIIIIVLPSALLECLGMVALPIVAVFFRECNASPLHHSQAS